AAAGAVVGLAAGAAVGAAAGAVVGLAGAAVGAAAGAVVGAAAGAGWQATTIVNPRTSTGRRSARRSAIRGRMHHPSLAHPPTRNPMLVGAARTCRGQPVRRGVL